MNYTIKLPLLKSLFIFILQIAFYNYCVTKEIYRSFHSICPRPWESLFLAEFSQNVDFWAKICGICQNLSGIKYAEMGFVSNNTFICFVIKLFLYYLT